MRYLLAVLLFVLTLTTCRTGRAETWQEFVRARAAAGLNDVQIHSALLTPGVSTSTVQVIETKDPAVVAWEQVALAEVEGFVEVVTGSRSNALGRVSNLSVPQMVALVRQAKATATPERRVEINDRADALMVMFLGAREKGYSWPLPADFGQAARVVQVQRVRPGRSRWDTLKPVGHTGEAPSLDEVRKAMGGER